MNKKENFKVHYYDIDLGMSSIAISKMFVEFFDIIANKIDSHRYMLSTSSTICSRTKSSQLILAMNEGFPSIAKSTGYFKLLHKSATVWEDWGGEFPHAKSREEVSPGGELVVVFKSSSNYFNHPKFDRYKY